VRKIVLASLLVVLLGAAIGVRRHYARAGVATRAPAADTRALGAALFTMQDATRARATAAQLDAAAHDGDGDAAVALGRLYIVGTPLFPRAPARALSYFRQAAATHAATAQYYLGVMTQRGEGVPADAARAAQLFTAAAAAGSDQAMLLLANAYRSGNGVARDERHAIELYQRAGEHGNAAALQTLAMAYRYGELGLERDESAAVHYQAEAEHALQEPSAP
jgi:TPR repeat protein